METVEQTPIDQAQPLGRYRLLRLLGRGPLSAWWVASIAEPSRGGDAELHLKVWHRSPLPGLSSQVWRAACAPVLGLVHPNIVQALDASIEEGQPVLAYEAVQGVSLAKWLSEHENMPARQAVLTVISVLDALAHAHAQGVVHGRLRPGNLMLDMAGRTRVTDFTVLPMPQELNQLPTASGLYLAPEMARGAGADVPSDIFATGLVLYELLCGKPAIQDAVPQRALTRLLEEDLQLPHGLRSIDHAEAQLRGIVARALSRDPQARFASAQAMRQALQDWLTPALLEGTADTRAGHTVNTLLQRLAVQPDLPVDASVVRRVRRLAAAERVNLGEIARAVLEDIAMTHKMLRMVNAAYFSSVGGGSITTVSRGIALMGFSAIRDLAGTLSTLDDMTDSTLAEALREEYSRCRTAGRLAARLCPTEAEEEESYIAAVLQNLGRCLVQFYLPDLAAQIRQLSLSQGGNEAAATLSVLGLSFEDLGVSIARTWGLPEVYMRAMRRPARASVIRAPEKRGDWFRLLAGLGNEVVESQLRREPRKPKGAPGTSIIEQYAHALGVSADDVWEAADGAGRPLQPAATLTPESRAAAAAPAAVPASAAASPAPAAAASPPAAADAVVHPLSRAIHELRLAMSRPWTLDKLLTIVGQAVYGSLQCHHVVLAVREPLSGMYLVRQAWGDRADTLRQHFRFPAGEGTDVFSALCAKGADTLIRDATAGNIASRLPPWFVSHVHAPTFMLLPVVVGRKTVAFLYADRNEVDGFSLTDRDLSLLRSLRDELRRAFEPQSGAA